MTHLKLIFLTLSLLLSACSTSSIQGNDQLVSMGEGDVEVLVPSGLRILAINGSPVRSPSLYEGKYLLRLSEGEQRIIVQYEENWNDNDESGYVIRWQPVAILESFKAGERYVLTHAPIKDRDQAIALIDTPPIWLIGGHKKVSGKPVTEETTIVRYVDQEQGQALPASPLMQLQTLWESSNTEEKAAFKKWLESQR